MFSPVLPCDLSQRLWPTFVRAGHILVSSTQLTKRGQLLETIAKIKMVKACLLIPLVVVNVMYSVTMW